MSPRPRLIANQIPAGNWPQALQDDLKGEVARDVRALREGQERHTAAIERLGDAMNHLADTLKKELRLMASLRADREFRKEEKERGDKLEAAIIAKLRKAGA